jgi:hypothetical protein
MMTQHYVRDLGLWSAARVEARHDFEIVAPPARRKVASVTKAAVLPAWPVTRFPSAPSLRGHRFRGPTRRPTRSACEVGMPHAGEHALCIGKVEPLGDAGIRRVHAGTRWHSS